MKQKFEPGKVERFPGGRRGRTEVLCLRDFVFSLLKAHDLITSPAYVVIKAAKKIKDKTTAINQLWQAEFTTRS
jgi:hypothetical protein